MKKRHSRQAYSSSRERKTEVLIAHPSSRGRLPKVQTFIVCSAGILGSFANADAQISSSPTASTRFDGTYAFVSSTKVNETWMSYDSHMGRCPDLQGVGPLIIANGQVRRDARLRTFEGTVGPQGELVMRSETLARHGVAGYELTLIGRIDGDGIVHARQISRYCN